VDKDTYSRLVQEAYQDQVAGLDRDRKEELRAELVKWNEQRDLEEAQALVSDGNRWKEMQKAGSHLSEYVRFVSCRACRSRTDAP
jgi:hypothetical protein